MAAKSIYIFLSILYICDGICYRPNCSSSCLNQGLPFLLAKKLEIRLELHLPHCFQISTTAGLQVLADVQMWGFIYKARLGQKYSLKFGSDNFRVQKQRSKVYSRNNNLCMRVNGIWKHAVPVYARFIRLIVFLESAVFRFCACAFIYFASNLEVVL